MSQHYAITMPQLSDTMTEGVVVTWEKQPGDRVERGDIVATVETDKAIMDVEVFKAGYLAGPLAEIGSTVPVGAAMAYITDTQGDLAIAAGEVVTEQAPSEMIPHHAGTPIVMPQLSDTMTEGIVVTWEKAIGDKIKRGDIVATVETDKAIMDVEVFNEGILSGPLADVGSTIEVGHPMAFIVQDKGQVNDTVATVSAEHKVVETHHVKPGEKIQAAPKPAAAPAPALRSDAKPAARPQGRKASPLARKLAGQMGVDLDGVAASGPEGAIVADDVQRARPSMKEVAHSLPQVDVPGEGRPMTSMEKAVSHAMTASLTLPTFNVTMNIDTAKLTAAAKARKVSVTVAIAKACSVAMAKFPRMNWAYQPMDKLVERGNHDFGIAVKSDDGGLVVPIISGIEAKSLEQMQADWNDLVPRARIRKLAPKEFANPTFTISNMGMFGVTHFTAIPTPGIAAILAIAANGPQGTPFTITGDHRVLNGADVAAYLAELKQVIEAPEAWMAGAGSVAAAAPAVSPIPEGNWDVQVAVIGGGPGGEDCARDLVEHGIKVAMINNAPFPGGECLWRGCIPSKAWRHAADIIRDRAHDADKGVTGTDKPKMVWETLEQHRKSILQTRGELALKTDKGVKIDVREGFASFVDAHTLKIVGPDGKESTLTFGAAVIATGAPPFVPPIPGARECLETGGVITSDTVWNLPKPPKKLGIVGGGVIGVEMAQIWRDFGADILMLEAKDRILAEIEEEIAKQLTAILNEEFKVVTSAKITEISGKPGKMTIKYSDAEGKADEYTCDYVLMATGKRPDTAKLNLEAVGVALDGAAIKVDASCRTNVPHIYAVGDVIGGYMLAHTAATQGRVAAHNLSGHALQYNQDLDCGVTFSRPEAGFVGLSLAQAKAKGIDAVEAKMPMSIDAKAMIALETHGMIKLVADKASQKIIGVHFLADHTDTLIGAAVMMVSGGMTLTQVAQAIFPHPTQTELFGELARRLLSRLRRTAKK
ncbi:dihydrolipoamide dehydrogenase [Sulfuritortus calidifontis]|uniref:Dihydrolipoamide acetyltransferase component of pyruvate dehydrogenase complex n=1 Tax=Sulfuritortus calidifontis TaxID=1914471 RepID=A0A4V2UQW5_9PROT|nr:FAD-dependent oxidoreductase [Sulfuritortus calidifontis]TCS72957.1 dihydrolipoamide dehydrogenase [Sulfuritortus calidifontis]